MEFTWFPRMEFRRPLTASLRPSRSIGGQIAKYTPERTQQANGPNGLQKHVGIMVSQMVGQMVGQTVGQMVGQMQISADPPKLKYPYEF